MTRPSRLGAEAEPPVASEFGVATERWMPLLWRPMPPAEWTPERKMASDAANEKRLRALVDHEMREPISAELTTLESLITEVLCCVKTIPPSRSVTLAADRLRWLDGGASPRIEEGDTGRVQMFLEPDLPYEVEFFAHVTGATGAAGSRLVSATLAPRTEAVRDLYQQLIFIYYRRERHMRRQTESSP